MASLEEMMDLQKRLEEAKSAQRSSEYGDVFAGAAGAVANKPTYASIMLNRPSQKVDFSGFKGGAYEKPQDVMDLMMKYEEAKKDRESNLEVEKMKEDRRLKERAEDHANAFGKEARGYAQQEKMKKLDVETDAAKKQATDETARKKQVTEVESRHSTIKNNLKLLKGLVDDTGGYDFTGPENDQMRQLVEDIATDGAKLSDPDSVARPAEVEQIKKMLINPSFFSRESTTQSLLDSFGQIADRKREAAYKVRGLEIPKEMMLGGAVEQAPKQSNDKAMAWAKANPSDPRAAAIMKKLGQEVPQLAR